MEKQERNIIYISQTDESWILDKYINFSYVCINDSIKYFEFH